MSFLSIQEIEKLGFKKIGVNVLISEKASFYNPKEIEIGNNTRIDDFCILSAGDEGIIVGNNVHIACYSSLIGKGRIVVEDFCNISSRVSIYSSNDDYSGNSLTGPTVPEKFKNVTYKDVVIGKHVIIGSGSVILPGLTIEIGAAIGALSLINRSCERFFIYSGIPAKKIKERSKKILELEKEFINSRQ